MMKFKAKENLADQAQELYLVDSILYDAIVYDRTADIPKLIIDNIPKC